MESKLHVTISTVASEVSETESSLLGSFTISWLLERDSEVLILNDSIFFICHGSFYRRTVSVCRYGLNLDIGKILSLNLSLDIEIALFDSISLEGILGLLEANQVRRNFGPGTISKNRGLIGTI